MTGSGLVPTVGRLILLLAVLGSMIVGCAEKKRTEIILGLATDLNAPTPLRSVALKVSHQPDDMVLATQMWSISGQPTLPDELPGSFAIYSASGTADRVRIELTGQDNFGKALVKRTAVLTLVPQRTLFVRLGVVTACLGVLDCGAGLTCVDGRCVSEEIDSSRLPEYKPGAEKGVACAGGTTYVNTSTKLPLTMTAATCTTGETCQEGVCLAPISGTGGRAGTADAGTGGADAAGGADPGTGGRTTLGTGGGSGVVVTIPGLARLTVSSSSQMITLAQSAGQIVPGMASFTAQATLDDGTMLDATNLVAWSLTPGLGSVTRGQVTVNTPGLFTVTAANGPIGASAQLTANFAGNFVDPAFNAADAAKLEGTATANAINIAYPLSGALFPSNFGTLTVQVSKSGAQDIARLSWSGDGLDVKFYGPCASGPGPGCNVNVPSVITQLFVGPSAQSNLSLTVRLASSAGGSLVESNTISLAWTDVPLVGGLYYWTTISPAVVAGYRLPASAIVGTGIERYNLDPTRNVLGPEPVPVYTDQGTPPNYYGSPPAAGDGAQCVGCHAISNDGTKMALTVGGSPDSDLALFNVATKTLTAFNPAASAGITNVMDINYYKQFGQPAFASETTFGPNGDVMVNMFRSQLTLHAANLSLANQGPVVPSWPELKTDAFWSSTGTYFVFASYPSALPGMYNPIGTNGDLKTGAQIMIADATAIGVTDNARVLVPRKAGFTSFYPVVSPDDVLIVYDQSACGVGGTDVNKMAIDYGAGPCDGYDDSTAELWLTTPGGQTPVRLTNANGGPGSDNSWPRFGPNIGTFRGQRLYWLVFSSRRPYGLQVNAAGVAPISTRPQLWLAAVVSGAASGDPSFAPVWFPNQNPNQALPSGNHTPQWVKVAVPIQ